MNLFKLALFFYFLAAAGFLYSIIFLKPFKRKRKIILRLSYFSAFLGVLFSLYARGYPTTLLLVAFFSLLISYIVWEIVFYIMTRER